MIRIYLFIGISSANHFNLKHQQTMLCFKDVYSENIMNIFCLEYAVSQDFLMGLLVAVILGNFEVAA